MVVSTSSLLMRCSPRPQNPILICPAVEPSDRIDGRLHCNDEHTTSVLARRVARKGLWSRWHGVDARLTIRDLMPCHQATNASTMPAGSDEQGGRPVTNVREVVWVDDLEVDVCWRLLARSVVGRIGFVYDGEPKVLPVNFRVAKSIVLFRTSREATLRGLGSEVPVAFEVDEADPRAETGWSVLVNGHLSEVVDASERAALAEAVAVHPWAPGPRDHWMKIVPSVVTGRAISRRRSHPDGVLLPYMPPD